MNWGRSSLQLKINVSVPRVICYVKTLEYPKQFDEDVDVGDGKFEAVDALKVGSLHFAIQSLSEGLSRCVQEERIVYH